MSSFQENVSPHARSQQTGCSVEPQAALDPRLLRVCCGERIVPRLAEIRQLGEPTLFLTVWLCPKCKKVTR